MSSPNVVSAAFRTEVAVIGAGVVGLAVARALSKAGKEVLILDRASAICSETSSRNSEVIHAGLYYPPSSKKAKFCVEGKRKLYEYCSSRNIPHRRCGKLIVSTDPEQTQAKLLALRDQAVKNGVSDIKLIPPEEVKDMEPEVECTAALYSPSTGVVDSHSFFLSLLADAEDAGSTLALHTEVDGAEAKGDGIYIRSNDSWLQCDHVINASGLWAHRIASLFHHDTAWKPPRQYFAKGTYFRLAQSPPFKRLIYPVPSSGGLGVHATIDYAASSVKFGPDAEWLDAGANPDRIDLNPHPERGDLFYKEIRKYWPGLLDGKLVPDYCGIRPKLYHPSLTGGEHPFVDFAIFGAEEHGVKGLTHLMGIESPGLTSSMAIADYVASNILRNAA